MLSMVAFCLLLLLAPRVVPGERIFEQDVDSLQMLEEVADARASQQQRADWNLFSRSGPKAAHIRQGRVGNCYYLAGLAAIANVHPELIQDAFVMKGQKKSKSGKKVYQVRFLLDGVETIVAMDETALLLQNQRRERGVAHPDGEGLGQALRLLLGKVGRVQRAGKTPLSHGEGCRLGHIHETFKAITQAPVDSLSARYDISTRRSVWQSTQELWSALKEGISEGFPVAASSVKNSVGVAVGHAFAVIGISNSSQTVEVYNPWAANTYTGRLMTDKKQQRQGAYNLTFSEFTRAFDSVDVARVRKNYRISFKRIPVNEPVALQFTVTKKRAAFAVQLEWPTTRFVSAHGCRLSPRDVRLLVAKKDGGRWRSGVLATTRSNVRLDFDEEGTYLVYAHVSFDAPVVSQAAVNIYAGEDVDLLEMATPPLLVGREILGWPCQFLVYPTKSSTQGLVFEAVRFAVGGSPAWRRWDTEELVWVDPKGMLARASNQSQKEALRPLKWEKFECREAVEYEAPEEEEWEPVKEETQACLGFKLGQRVHFTVSGKKSTCGEIVDIDPEGPWVHVRHHVQEVDFTYCSSLKKVDRECDYQDDDQVEFYQDGEWLSDVVEELGCGSAKLANNGRVDCASGGLRYPHGCRFHAGEKVSLWIDWEERWQNATVIETDGGSATVANPPHAEQALPCDGGNRLRKMTRCDKLIHDQLERLSQLNNADEILEEGTDSLFPPELDSIGPPSVGCGDSATGKTPTPCDKFNSWGALSEVLK